MPQQLTYPGVYIEEIPSGVRTITGVATSIAAFVDSFMRGPTDRAVQILGMADFEREFGGLDASSEGSYAIQQFFLNGGSEAWVVRVAPDDAERASVDIATSTAAGSTAFIARAKSEGEWGNSIRIRVDNKTPASGEFNLTVLEYTTVGGRSVIAKQEVFRNLSMDSSRTNFVGTVVNDTISGSKIIDIIEPGNTPPLSNGTLSGEHTENPDLAQPPQQFTLTIADGSTHQTADAILNLPQGPTDLATIAPALESAIRAAAPASTVYSGANVSVVGNRLLVLAGAGSPANQVSFQDGPLVQALKLIDGASVNLQEYILGVGAIANTAQRAGTEGENGSDPVTAGKLIGDLNSKSGIYALEDVPLFNILCIPRTAGMVAAQANAVITVAETYCENRRAFFIMDTPTGISDIQGIKNWLEVNATLRNKNAALYYPRIMIPDPLNDFRLRSVGASGTIAGLFARTDSNRGVWKAPAGTDASLINAPALEDVLTDLENGVLNPLAINCLRNFPIYGNVCWGARTLDGSDQEASEWKYIPVRRVALFIEESLFRGTQWVVFEPNDEPLWSQIRLNIGAFMHNLFTQGAFQGSTPKEAYFVKCDKETTTQNDINLGIVNIVVGFAPLKPAEFVVIKLQQMAGQVQA